MTTLNMISKLYVPCLFITLFNAYMNATSSTLGHYVCTCNLYSWTLLLLLLLLGGYYVPMKIAAITVISKTVMYLFWLTRQRVKL